MIPAMRSQSDDLGDIMSLETGIDCSAAPDTARQEFKDESDINLLLSRFGVTGRNTPPTFGEVDYSLDLQQALGAIHDAKRTYARLPIELREKYESWQSLLNAVEDGSFEGEVQPRTVPSVPTPAAPAEA